MELINVFADVGKASNCVCATLISMNSMSSIHRRIYSICQIESPYGSNGHCMHRLERRQRAGGREGLSDSAVRTIEAPIALGHTICGFSWSFVVVVVFITSTITKNSPNEAIMDSKDHKTWNDDRRPWLSHISEKGLHHSTHSTWICYTKLGLFFCVDPIAVFFCFRSLLFFFFLCLLFFISIFSVFRLT